MPWARGRVQRTGPWKRRADDGGSGLGQRAAKVQSDTPRYIQFREENRLLAAIEVGLPNVSHTANRSSLIGPVHQALRHIQSNTGRVRQIRNEDFLLAAVQVRAPNVAGTQIGPVHLAAG